jgi:hypothetical protein
MKLLRLFNYCFKHKRIKFMYFINLRALSNGDLEGQTQALYYELT